MRYLKEIFSDNKIYHIVIWAIVVLCVISGLTALFSSWNEQHRRAEAMRLQVIDGIETMLRIQDRLEQNGKIAENILLRVNENQADILNKIDKMLSESNIDLAASIHEHQKVSRAMFMSEFSKILGKGEVQEQSTLNNQAFLTKNCVEAQSKLDKILELLNKNVK